MSFGIGSSFVALPHFWLSETKPFGAMFSISSRISFMFVSRLLHSIAIMNYSIP